MYVHCLYMNTCTHHLYRTPQCTKKELEREKERRHTLTHEYTTIPFPTHNNSLNGLEIVLTASLA